MTLEEEISHWMVKLNPSGYLAHTAKLLMALGKINHPKTVEHDQRVALMSRAVAERLSKNQILAFFGGLLHDIGKFILPPELLNKHKLTAEEFALIKTHARSGFTILRDLHEFTALCVGLHHGVYEQGYGLTAEDFPQGWPDHLIQKVLGISMIISICDYADVATHRTTKVRDGSDQGSLDLKTQLLRKFPGQEQVIEAALQQIIA